MQTPKNATDEQIAALFDQELTPAMALNAALQRLHDIMNKPADQAVDQIRENRARRAAEMARHAEFVRKEVHERYLNEIDANWRDRFGTNQDAAELFYWREIEAKKHPLIRGGKVVHVADPDDVDFDDGLTADDAR